MCIDSVRSGDAVLSISVWDKDVLTADDFAGEAFVALARVPGINVNGPPDPLRPVELPLMQLHDRSEYLSRLTTVPTTSPQISRYLVSLKMSMKVGSV